MNHRFRIFAAMACLCIPVLSAGSAPKGITIVAAENFYGNIAAQLGGAAVNVTSILSDPERGPARVRVQRG